MLHHDSPHSAGGAPAPEVDPAKSSPKIDLGRVRIVPKLSKVEWDMRCLGLSYDQVVEKYRQEGSNVDTIVASHETQQQSLAKLRQIFDASQFVARDALDAGIDDDADLVVAFGGDNHFTYVSHFVRKALILGVNSDPQRSDGALTSISAGDLERALQAIASGEYDVEEWTRIEARVNGQLQPLATSELYVGENERKSMSRYVLKHGDREEPQKSSGLLVTTGAGSTGWYDSACRYLHPEGNPFPRTAKEMVYLATEPFKGRLNQSKMLEGVVKEGETLSIKSLNDSEGIVSVDSLDEVSFNRGAALEVKVSDSPLKVLKIR